MADLLIITPSGSLTGDKTFAGAKATFFDAGTTTPATVYSDDALTIPHPSPLVAGADGLWPEIFVSGSSFKAVVVYSDDTTCYTLDPCPKSQALGSSANSVSFSPTAALPRSNVQAALELIGTAALFTPSPTGTSLLGAVDGVIQEFIFGQVLHVQDASALNYGGGFTAGSYVRRDLQTVVKNTIPGATLVDHQITLPAGTYFVMAGAQGYNVNAHAIRLRKVDGTAVNLAHGTVQYSPSVSVASQLIGEFTITETSTIELQHRCAVTQSVNGMGVGTTLDVNIYAEVFIQRIA